MTTVIISPNLWCRVFLIAALFLSACAPRDVRPTPTLERISTATLPPRSPLDLTPPLRSPTIAVSTVLPAYPTPNPFRFSTKLMQFAWFYKPPQDGDLAALSRYYSVFILTQVDELVRDKLRANGVKTPFLQYLLFNEIHDPASCSAQPYRDQVANKPGDFCSISKDHPDWFLRDTRGHIISNKDVDGVTYVLMDPGNLGWRSFWLQRAQASQKELGWDGVFLDNVEASLDKLEQRGIRLSAYPDHASYQSVIEGFLSYLHGYFRSQNRPMLANIIALQDQAVWFRYLQDLDGAMEERFSVDWLNDYLSVAEWEEQLDRAEKTQALSKHIILVAQGDRRDIQREQFALASYLLVAQGNASFRYTNSHSYEETWLYNNYRIDLGSPKGLRYRKDTGWQRDFENYIVYVDPSTHSASITPR